MTLQGTHILLPLPSEGFEATEAAVPWQALTRAGVRVTISTPDGQAPSADGFTADGARGPLLANLMFKADKPALEAYRQLQADASFQAPLPWSAIDAGDYDGIVLPGGHAPGMVEFLGSAQLQRVVSALDASGKLVASICHGVLLAARSQRADGRSVLHGRRITTVPARVENMLWRMFNRRIDPLYGRPCAVAAEEEMRSLLRAEDFDIRMPPLRKDAPGKHRGLCIVDGHIVTARMPHDAYTFAAGVVETLQALVEQRAAGGAEVHRLAV